MNDEKKSKELVIEDLTDAKRFITQLQLSAEAEHKSAKEVLREVEEQLHVLLQRVEYQKNQLEVIFHNLPQGVMLFDETGAILWFNSAAMRMYGFAAKEDMHRNLKSRNEFISLEYPDGRTVPDREEPVSRALNGETVTDLEMHIRLRETGNFRTCTFDAIPIRNREDKVFQAIVTLSDITARKQIEEVFWKAATEIEDLYNNAPCGYHSLDKDGFIIRINDTELAWLGYSREEIIGKVRFSDIITPSSHQTFMEAFPLFKERGWVEDLQYEMIRKDGSILPVSLSSTAVIDSNGNYVMSRAVLFDNTIRKRAEEEREKIENQLMHAQRLEALGSFAGGIAHNLNNILYPIIINTEMLLEEAQAGTGLHETLDQTLNAAYRQRDLIKQILFFSRQSDLKFKQIKIVPLLKETLDLFKASVSSIIDIREHIEASSDTVMGDPTQIQQVVINLCKNASDALGLQKGIIEVSLTDTYLDSVPAHPELKQGKYIVFKARDTGSGMPAEVVERIFEPFYTTKDVGKGSGMGLSVVHGIVKNHGGAVTAESEPGKGSLFTVYLPICDVKPGTKTPGIGPSEKEKARILLVDDEVIILSSLKRSLERSGYTVETAQEGNGALKLLEEAPGEFDLVITDLTMPGITGIELAKRLIKIHPDIPVILCTGFGDVISEQEARSMGIREVLLKPSSTDDLKNAVSRALQS